MTGRQRPKYSKPKRRKVCPVCKGSGGFEVAGRVRRCRKCRGTGYLRK